MIVKSSQELAAQVERTSSITLSDNFNPDDDTIKESYKTKYKELRDPLVTLLQTGADELTLSKELQNAYLVGKKNSLYHPLIGNETKNLLTVVTNEMLQRGFTQQEAEQLAIEKLSDGGGYVEALRRNRQYDERNYHNVLNEFINFKDISPEEERIRLAEISKKIITLRDLDEVELEQLTGDFPNGNFLYHGAYVKQLVGILNSGDLMNVHGLWEREQKNAKIEGRDPSTPDRHSGYEGISWSLNRIGALPGDRYHLAGFICSPSIAINSEQQLSIPSRPAPYEVIQIDKNIDASKYYSLKSQQELLLEVVFLGEHNSVLSNLSTLKFLIQSIKEGKPKSEFSRRESMLLSFIAKYNDNEINQKLEDKFTISDDKAIEFSEGLLQQIDDDIPVGAVWIKGLIDSGRIKECNGFEDITTDRGFIERISLDNFESLIDQIRFDKRRIDKEINIEDEKIVEISVPIEDMYFVTSIKDIHKWMKVLSRCPRLPKGILLYDHNKVRLEHFASQHTGDFEALTSELQQAISPRQDGYIDYESQVLQTELTDDKFTGYRRHVVHEQHLKKRRSIVLGKDNNLIII